MKNLCLLLICLKSTHHVPAEAYDTEVVITDPGNGIVKEGKRFHLQCRYRGVNKSAYWYKNGNYIGFENQGFQRNANSYSGASYQCQTQFSWSSSAKSEPLEVVTIASGRILTLEVKPRAALLGESIDLRCVMSPWRSRENFPFLWYRDKKLIAETDQYQYTIENAKESDAAAYRCELKIRYRKWVSPDVDITVRELCSKPILKAESEDQLFVGQQLKLVCSVDTFHPDYPLRYLFTKNGQALNVATDQKYYITETAGRNDSGTYLCEVTTFNKRVKKLSNEVSISVKRIPVSKPDLEISPGKELIEGDTASLTCSVSNGSTPITYIFYKDSSEQLYREESELTGITYQINKVNERTEGNYSCGVSNEAAEPPLHSESVAFSVIVPVAGASLTSNTNNTEISAGYRLVLQCLLTSGTAPHFRWYLNNQQLESTSESYHLNTDGSELIINSFQIGHGGRYHCAATNRGTYEGLFNTTSNYIDFTVPVQSHTTVITASVLPLFLIAALIVLLLFKFRKKKQDNSSSVPQPQGEATGNGSQTPSEETSASNFEYAVVGSASNTASSSDQATYCVVQGMKPMEDDTKPAADLVYSVVTISKLKDGVNDGGASGGRQDNKNGPSDYCITYATVNRENTEASLEGDLMEEGDGSDTNVYENLPRK